MLFKTNTNSHKHPGISPIIMEQDTIDEAKENNILLFRIWRKLYFANHALRPIPQNMDTWYINYVIQSFMIS